MKSKFLLLCTIIILTSILLPSCKSKDTDKAESPEIIVPVPEDVPGIDEATWDLYMNTPLMAFVNDAFEQERSTLAEEWDSCDGFCELTQQWTPLEEYTFFDILSSEDHFAYTLATVTNTKKTTDETQMSQDKYEYIFLEYCAENNSFSVKGGFSKTIRKNGFYETIENSVLSKEYIENILLEKLSMIGASSLPSPHELTDDKQPTTTTRRYNHKPVNTAEMCLKEFPDTTIIELLSRFDDAYGELFGKADEDYSFVSFDCYTEYDWLASNHLNEFTDCSDNKQPHTYSAVYNVKDKDGISLVARLDLFTEIEPNKQTLSLIESVFSITYAGELVFEDIHNLEETVLLLDTIVMYHPEDVVVTPTTEEVEEQLLAEEAVATEAEEAEEADTENPETAETEGSEVQSS